MKKHVQNSLWFSTVNDGGMLSVTHSASIDPATINTQLAFWTGDCNNFNSLSLLGANDDGGAGTNAMLSACVPPGPILVQLDGHTGSAGIGKLDFALSATNPPTAKCRDVDVNVGTTGTATITPSDVNDGSTFDVW